MRKPGDLDYQTVAPEALESSCTGGEKDIQPVISCRLEGIVSVQPETLFVSGSVEKAGRWGWLDRVKKALRIAR